MKPSKAKSKTKRRRLRTTLGASPGVISVEPGGPKSDVHVMGFGPEGFVEKHVESTDEIAAIRGAWPVVWVHVVGLRDLKTLIYYLRKSSHRATKSDGVSPTIGLRAQPALCSLQKVFLLHNLALEDAVDQNQRPKVEIYDDHGHLVLFSAANEESLSLSQLNIFLGNGFVVSMAETYGNWEEPVRRRIREKRARFQTLGAGYLAYALVDSVVDHYFPIMNNIADKLDSLEESALKSPGRGEIIRIHKAGGELMSLRRALAPLKDVLSSLFLAEHAFIDNNIRIYFRDCYDHTAQLLDEIETDRELARSLVDTTLSSINNRMNEVMKVLTIIATIFIPLSFIAGVYGMNFDGDVSPLNMPELKWRFGYPFALSLMLLTSLGLLYYFRKKGWLGATDRPEPDHRSGADQTR
jgi:magnesium transporter